MEQELVDLVWQEIQRGGALQGRRVHYFETVESTNTLALTMGREGERTGSVLVAETQSGGRGRLGKSWSSPPGTGLYCSVLLRPAVSLQHLSRITLAAGLAVSRAIDEVCEVESAIKWPNDIVIQGRKVAGILTECDISDGKDPLVALGIGINLTTQRWQFPQEVQFRASSLLLMSGKVVAKGRMLQALLPRIDQMVNRLERADFAGILDEWRAKDATLGQWLTWLAISGQTVHGVSLGPDQEGQLVVRDSAGECHHVISGDIELDPNRLNGYFP